MQTSTVEIDLNDIDEEGLTVALLSDASGPLEPGRMTIAYENEDRLAAPALVASVRTDLGIAYLRLNWRALSHRLYNERAFRLDPVHSSSAVRSRRAGAEIDAASRRIVARGSAAAPNSAVAFR
ncbi:hypothetical protein [Agromyces flavus]|uniref:hypothetical protein n=1 Tax=Agromyces flavus TaxID=589382 RepID=UPI0010633317|nr:hypothetical protein [Agromyces flavus]GGI43945.1 hypothetical protein GCM10010932_02130 [Agromyces flavus]